MINHTRLGLTGLFLTVALALLVLIPVQQAQGRGMAHGRATSSLTAIAPWSDSLSEYGMPSAPTMWQPPNWDVQIHTRDMNATGGALLPQMADHGADCAAPPAQHQITTWQQAVFVCHNHMMSAIADEGYGEAAFTPNRMADWSAGPVVIGLSISTTHLSQRDWWALDVTPFGEQLALPFDDGGVDLAGMPAHFIDLRTDNCDFDTIWRVARELPGATGDASSFGDEQSHTDCLKSFGIQPSATVRTPFEFVISQTGYILRIGASSAVSPGAILTQGNWTRPLTFNRGVVQFLHHSYNPLKCSGCLPDTWHWSDFSISSAVQYTLLRPTDHQVVVGTGPVTFGSSAPSGSYLKFAGIGSIAVSYDGGATYHTPAKPPMDALLASHPEHFANYLDSVPAGVTQALFKVSSGGMARDFSLISQSFGGAPAPTATPVPPTVTPLPTLPPMSTPTPGPTPIPLNNTPCTVTLPSGTQAGHCSGTFTP
jgi:hypothetical protein